MCSHEYFVHIHMGVLLKKNFGYVLKSCARKEY
jgi:hypothetical protein